MKTIEELLKEVDKLHSIAYKGREKRSTKYNSIYHKLRSYLELYNKLRLVKQKIMFQELVNSWYNLSIKGLEEVN